MSKILKKRSVFHSFVFLSFVISFTINGCSDLEKNNTNEGLNIMPNIILIVADDLGYADLEVYGNKNIKTPNTTRLAKEGILFTDFHTNGPMCSPTRAALLTGRYQQRTGVETVGGVLREDEIVIAQRLKEVGYKCGMFGKWHISGHNKSPNFYKNKRLPTNFGFDEFRGIMSGFIDPISHFTDIGINDWWYNDNLVTEEGYSTHLLTNHAINFIKKNKNNPFFVYLPLTDIHFPWMTPEDEPYFKEGTKYKNFEKNNNRLGPHEGTDSLQKIVHRMIIESDKCLGNILEMVDELKLSENTLVIFTSDNGGYNNYQGSNEGNISSMGPYRGQKGSLYEGGHRVPAIAWWPGKISAGQISDETLMTHDIFPTFLELAGLDFPDSINSNKLDGISLAPLLIQGNSLPERTLYWAFGNNRAIRKGKWKFIKRGENNPELYNLESDPGEKNNVANSFPGIIDSLKNSLSQWEIDVFNRNKPK